MVSIRQKFYKHILDNNLKENDEWTIKMQDEFYNTLNGYERSEFDYLIEELIEQGVLIKQDNGSLVFTNIVESKTIYRSI